jgi:hypothetical protein
LVKIGLVGVRGEQAGVAHITHPICVAVVLVIGHRGTDVTRVTEAIAVTVALCRVSHSGAHIAEVAEPISIAVGLVRVRQGRTHITGICNAICIAVELVGVGDKGACIASVAESVSIGVELVGVRCEGAVVLRVTAVVAVAVHTATTHRALKHEEGIGVRGVVVPLTHRRHKASVCVLEPHEAVRVVIVPAGELIEARVVAWASSATGAHARVGVGVAEREAGVHRGCLCSAQRTEIAHRDVAREWVNP